MRALVGFSLMTALPAPELIEALHAIVFTPANLSSRVQAQAIREQAILTLGAVVCNHF